MPLYELFCLARPTLLKTQLAELIKRTATMVMENDGVVTQLTYFGSNTLSKAVRSGNQRFTDALMFDLRFHTKTSLLPELEHEMQVNENILRWVIIRHKSIPKLPHMNDLFKEIPELCQKTHTSKKSRRSL